MQIDCTKSVKNLKKKAALFETPQLLGETELVEKDIADIRRKFRDVIEKVLVKVRCVLTL
jgi:hypothetical protein